MRRNPEVVRIKRRDAPRVLNTLIVAGCAAAGLVGPPLPGAAAETAPGAPASAPRDQAVRSAIGLAFDSNGSGFAFYRGGDNAIYMRTFFDAAHWSPERRVGGLGVGAPAAAVARTTAVVAVRGVDNALWLRAINNGTWGRWTRWGGTLRSSPAVTGGTDGGVDVFARGADDALWTRALRPGGRLTPWRSMGGHLSTAPAAVAIGNGVIEVAAAGADHVVWRTSTATGKWLSIGSRTYSAPAIGYIPQSNGMFVLTRRTDDRLWAIGLGGGGSTGWRRLGGALTEGPSAVGTREPRPYIIAAVRGTDQAVWTTTYPTGQGWWSPFTRAWGPGRDR